MDRAIAGFHQDKLGDWIAELACGHAQHVRHRPPFEDRPWVLDCEGRRRRIGTSLKCPFCDEKQRDASDEGGDSACWLGDTCWSCGIVLDGSPHRPNCEHIDATDPVQP